MGQSPYFPKTDLKISKFRFAADKARIQVLIVTPTPLEVEVGGLRW